MECHQIFFACQIKKFENLVGKSGKTYFGNTVVFLPVHSTGTPPKNFGNSPRKSLAKCSITLDQVLGLYRVGNPFNNFTNNASENRPRDSYPLEILLGYLSGNPCFKRNLFTILLKFFQIFFRYSFDNC